MLEYYVIKLLRLFYAFSNDTIPTLEFDIPDYHDTWRSICGGLGVFIDLNAISKLILVTVTYDLIRIACAFRRHT